MGFSSVQHIVEEEGQYWQELVVMEPEWVTRSLKSRAMRGAMELGVTEAIITGS